MYRPMLKLWVFLFVWATASCATSRPVQPPQPTQAAPAPVAQKTILAWHVKPSAPGMGSVYLVGSIHLWNEGRPPIDPAAQAAFETADDLVVEVDLEATPPNDLQHLLLKRALLPGNQSLEDRLSKETYQALVAELERKQMPLIAMKRFKPWFQVMTLALLQLKELGYDGEHGVDRHFMSQARGKKPIVSLESADFQIRMLDGFPEPIQELMLRELLRGKEQVKEHFDKMIAAYRDMDLVKLEEAVFLPALQDPTYRPLYAKLFTERNHSMAQGIEGLLGQERTRFVVVGVGHMLGDQGIPALLRKRGYQVEQMKAAMDPREGPR